MKCLSMQMKKVHSHNDVLLTDLFHFLTWCFSGSKRGPCYFTDPNPSREVDRNANVQLTCASLSLPTPREFEWFKDEKQLPANATEENADQSKSVLTIRNTSRSDSGKYKCVCKGESGSHSKRDVIITLHVRGEFIINTL